MITLLYAGYLLRKVDIYLQFKIYSTLKCHGWLELFCVNDFKLSIFSSQCHGCCWSVDIIDVVCKHGLISIPACISVGQIFWSIPHRLHHWSLGMYILFHHALIWTCHHLSMPGLNLIHDRYVGPWVQSISIHDLGYVYLSVLWLFGATPSMWLSECKLNKFSILVK